METFVVHDHGVRGTVVTARYTVNVYIIFIFFFYWKFIVNRWNEEVREFDFQFYVPSLQVLVNFIVFILATGGELSRPEVAPVDLRKKAKDLFRNFLLNTKLMYLGIHEIVLTNAGGVLHPVDNFVKRLYEKHFPRQAAVAFATYKRTNPTLELRLEQLEKFAEPNVASIPVSELELSLDTLLTQIFVDPGFDAFSQASLESVRTRDFASINVDFSSASGFPFKQGRKKRDDRVEAELVASQMLDDDAVFESYVHSHVWYTTGRAKLQTVDAYDSGRLIIYAGYSYLLVAMLSLQYWCQFMNCAMDWCGVGFSWMHDGAGKLAKRFEADKGYAPAGYRYVSLDISGWDNKLHRSLMMLLIKFYRRLFQRVGLPQSYVERLCKLVHYMIEASVLFPMGHLFKLNQGMKSGWAATANDNTLLHELVMRAIMTRNNVFIKHILYGDDNFMLVPDHISDDLLVEEYARFGLNVKYIHSSRCISDVDFLSKRIVYRNGRYYVFRESVETHSRLLMPEEMDPRRRNRPDPVIAVERILGHLLDNPFNGDVRRVCYKLLRLLRDEYSVDYIEVHDGLIRQHPWRNFDVSMIPRRFPTVPDEAFIEELYGVPITRNLRIVWPRAPDYVSFSRIPAVDCTLYRAASEFCNDVQFQLDQVANKRAKSIVKKLSPFKQPKRCYGFHAARFEFAIKYFSIEFDSLLDLGAHPGACAASASKYCNRVVCVSKKPGNDPTFCPYVTRGAEVACIQADADHFVPRHSFDLQHDDVDVIGKRSTKEDVLNGLGMIRRARMNSRWVSQALFTLKEVDWRTAEDLYELYKDFGHIDFVKPLFSNPWKSEFMVYVRKEKAPRMRKGDFLRQYFGFLNDMAPHLFRWSELLLNAISNFRGAEVIEPNVNQTDSFESEWIRAWDHEYATLDNCTPLGADAHLKDLDEVSSTVCQP